LLAAALVQLSQLTFKFDTDRLQLYHYGMLALIASGALAGLAGAVLAWRTARSPLGSLRGVLSA
jgi:hypothetical protein